MVDVAALRNNLGLQLRQALRLSLQSQYLPVLPQPHRRRKAPPLLFLQFLAVRNLLQLLQAMLPLQTPPRSKEALFRHRRKGTRALLARRLYLLHKAQFCLLLEIGTVRHRPSSLVRALLPRPALDLQHKEALLHHL